MKTHEIKYEGVNFTIDGNFTKGESATLDHPGYPDVFEIENIYISGQDVTHLIDESIIESMENMVYQKYYS